MDLDTQGRTRDQIERQAGDAQIGVITLMRLMWKWKIVILAGTLGCALAALLISNLIPHVYEVDMLVENVQIGTDKAGERVYLGDLQNISNRIGARAFNQDILDNLSEQYKEGVPRRLSFKVSLENKNQFAKIVYETVDVEMGEKILSQLFKRLQETNLVRVEHWKKEIDSKIEEKRAKISGINAQIDKGKEQIVLAQKTKHSMKQEMLAEAKADKRAKEDMIKRLQKEINNVAVKRKIDISEKMSDMKAEKSKNEDTIKKLDKRNSEIKSSIKLFESEIYFLIKTRKELLSISIRNETRDMGVVGELSSVIMDGYDQLNKLREEVLDNDDLMLQARLRIQELDSGIEKLRNGSEVTPIDVKVIKDRIRQAKLDIEALESRVKKSSDELAMSSSTEKPNNYLGYTIAKARDHVDLIMEEIGTLEANKKKVKNIVLLQPPTSGVSPLRPDTKRNVVIGAVVGLFLSLFLSVFLEYVYKKEA
jgi:LPS O-antigen subunit length determinant protein (WzzB/FepE family)